MRPANQLHHQTIPDLREAALPGRTLVEASLSEKSDALLAFCDRANFLKQTLCLTKPPKGGDFGLHTERLTTISKQVGAGETPEGIALDLATLVTTYLNSNLNAEEAQYWLAVTSALIAATRETMPKFSNSLNETRSAIFARQAEISVPYPERYT